MSRVTSVCLVSKLCVLILCLVFITGVTGTSNLNELTVKASSVSEDGEGTSPQDGEGSGDTGGSGSTLPGGGEPSTTTPPSGPGAPEICGDGIDNNAEGHIDEGCQTASGTPGETPAAPPGDEETQAAPPGDEETQAAPPGDGNTTTTPPGDGNTTTTPPGDGNTTTTPPGDGNTTTTPPGEAAAAPPQTNGGNTTQPGNATFVTINNAIAQAFSSTTYNTNVLRQAAQNTLLVGEETIPLIGTIASSDSRLLSTFDPFRLVGGSVIIYLPPSNIPSPNPIQILALDGDSNEMAILQSSKIPIGGNAYKIVLAAAFSGINPATGNQVNVDNIKALFLINNSNQPVTFGFGSSVALLTIVR
jgi:hypothetical protein